MARLKKNGIKITPRRYVVQGKGDMWYLEMKYFGCDGELVNDCSFGPSFTSRTAAREFAKSVVLVRKP